MSISDTIQKATDELCSALQDLSFGEPVSHVYNPLTYASEPHREYLRRFADSQKRVILMGMNPGPWGMAQTGVPFGEIPAVRDWMGINEIVSKPNPEHPKRPVEGFGCAKSEVSGRRLWGLFAERFPVAKDFFADHYVVNYCPLVWMEETGRNRTPDKLPAREMEPVLAACDRYVKTHLQELGPEFAVGVGAYAETCLKRICDSAGLTRVKTGRILHPSPASPAANRDWAGTVSRQLAELGVWIT